MAKRLIYILLIGLVFAACKKEDRKCWKSHGEETSLEIPLDSVGSWVLNPKIKYRIFQDSTRRLIVKGGANMVNQIAAEYDGDQLTISNNNKCNFLRSSDRQIEVEIHYPHIKDMYMEPSDSVVFEGTINTDSLRIEMREAGGSLIIDVNTQFVSIIVSHGTADFTVSGNTYRAEMKVQDKGYGDARLLDATSYFAYQNSTNDLYIDIEDAGAIIAIDGIGHIYATGSPVWLLEEFKGTGKFIMM